MQGNSHDEEYIDPHGECAHEIAVHRNEAQRLRALLLNLANAADVVGVRFFDTDTMEPEVEAMQTATQAARAALT